MIALEKNRSFRLARRWPFRILNHLPRGYQLKFLTWKAGGADSNPLFDLGRELGACRRILLAVPESFLELLVALPVLQTYRYELSEREIYLLANRENSAFLSALFGREALITWDSGAFFYDDPHFHALGARLRELGLDLSLNLNPSASPLFHFLLKGSLAPLRVELFTPEAWPFANVRLLGDEPPNLLRRFLMAARLWDYVRFPLRIDPGLLQPDKPFMARAEALFQAHGLRPGRVELFLWQGSPSDIQTGLWSRLSRGRRQDSDRLPLVVVYGENIPLRATFPPDEVRQGGPCFKADGIGEFLALASLASRCHGMNGELLHLAVAADAQVEGYFLEGDRIFDTSFLRRNLSIHPLESGSL